MAFAVVLDSAAIWDMLNSPDGPVGNVIDELSGKATGYAKIKAPLQKPENWSWGFAKSTSYEPRSVGYLKSRIHEHFPAYNGAGQLYGGVNAPYGPTLFLERPARQIHSTEYRFMSGALDALTL